jgi:hypothetical protein
LQAISTYIGPDGSFAYGAAEVRYDSFVTPFTQVNGTAYPYQNYATIDVQPNAPFERELTMQLDPNSRIHLVAVDPDTVLKATFQWIEEDI